MDEKLILVIDDSQFLCTMLKKSLDSVGYNTLVAYTTEEGMRLLESSAPDLVLLDINLPDISGPEACKVIKANPRYARTSVILMSGSYEEYIKQKVAECGANGYIKKPFSPSSILRWVKENSSSLFPGDDEEEGSEDKQFTIDDIARTGQRRPTTSAGRTVPPPPVQPPLAASRPGLAPAAKAAPAAPPPAAAPRPPAPPVGLVDGKGKTIVVTDDSTFLCAILRDTLEKVGFKVSTFSTIRDTGYFLKGNHADLLFLDVNLPDISGDRACAIIKESPRTHDLPIILISSAKEEALRAMVNKAGANGYLIKPFTPLNVLEWIKNNAEALFGLTPPPAPVPAAAQAPHVPPPQPRSYAGATTAAPPPQPAAGRPAPVAAPAAPSVEETGPTQGEIEILLRQLSSPLKEVRLDACYTLGEFKVQAAVEPLMEMLYDKDDEIRGEAAWALGEVRDARALQPVLNLLLIKNKWLRDRALEALGKFGDDRAIGPIVQMLQTPDRELRVTAIKALAGIPSPQSREALEKLVTDPDEAIAGNATWALRRLDGRA